MGAENAIIHLMSELDRSDQRLVLALGKKVEYAKGEFIFQQGDAGDALYLVDSGSIEISILSEDGKKLLLNMMKAGDVFGEIAALDGGERTATAMAAIPTKVTKYNRSDLIALITEHPEMAIRTIALLCERLRWVSQQVEDLAMLDVEGRLANRLLILHRKFADETGKLKMSQAELGDFLGVSRESINKVLQAWRAKGYIELGRGSIRVRNPDFLEVQGAVH